MPDTANTEDKFIKLVTEIIEENISNDQFGVSELASAVGMSRSNLLRKVQKQTKLSVSKFIMKIRLERAMEILKQNSSNVSEVSYKVGFSSTSYFIKCFREFYGYPPGEAGKRGNEVNETVEDRPPKKSGVKILWVIAGIIIAGIVAIVFLKQFQQTKTVNEKSIAILPFINDSNDSTNIYIINGLMESILNNLQKIEDLKVISRTSVEKYRNTNKTIPEIAEELNVSYILEGSGQKIGDKILLNVQLIEAKFDDHLWAEQYNREVTDIFSIQKEVSKKIADQIEVLITPEEEERINKQPTENLIAYDYFLRGIDCLNRETREGLEEGIPLLLKAVEYDDEFARAFGALALAYYYLDIYQIEKKHSEQLNHYADKAILFDPKLAPGLTAKALYYMQQGDYKQAVIYLEKALEYNPNSALVINTLSDLYATKIPNTEKYLEYALRGVSLDIASRDSSTASFIFLHLSNALIQTGFVDEALNAIDRSLEFNPRNLYSVYVRAYILYAKNKNLKQTKALLIKALEMDTTRLDIMQEIGNVCYYQRDYDCAYAYFKKFKDIMTALNMNIYTNKNIEIAFVYNKMGFTEEAQSLLASFKNFAENDNSIYRHLHLAYYNSYLGQPDKAVEHMKQFSEVEDFQYWILLFTSMDPLIAPIKDNPEFKKAMKNLEDSFWKNHRQIKASLEKKGVL